MIVHLFKLVWNRKRHNAMILFEIFLAFLVLFGVATMGFYNANNYLQNLGFDYQNVWALEITRPARATKEDQIEKTIATTEQILLFLDNQNAIQSYSMADVIPYGGSTWNDYSYHQKRKVLVQLGRVQPSMQQTLDVEILKGRFIERGDEALDLNALVVNQMYAEKMFPGEDPLGKRIKIGDKDNYKIVGVITDYRKDGELALKFPFAFMPLKMGKDVSWWFPEYILMKMGNATPASVEEGLIKGMERIAEGWSFKIKPMSAMRTAYLRKNLAFLVAASLIAGFLLIMVAMGLVGVLWQNVTRRTAEVGLRRAKGATRKKILTQILGEFLVITTLAIVLALVVAVQIPVLGLFEDVSYNVLSTGFLGTAAVIYGLTIISSLYPSWLATTVNPAEALHYE